MDRADRKVVAFIEANERVLCFCDDVMRHGAKKRCNDVMLRYTLRYSKVILGVWVYLSMYESAKININYFY